MTLEEISASKQNIIDELDNHVTKLDNQYSQKIIELNNWYNEEYDKLVEAKDKAIKELNEKEKVLLEKQNAEKNKELEKVRKAYADYEALRNKYNETYGTEVDNTDWIVDLFRNFL